MPSLTPAFAAASFSPITLRVEARALNKSQGAIAKTGLRPQNRLHHKIGNKNGSKCHTNPVLRLTADEILSQPGSAIFRFQSDRGERDQTNPGCRLKPGPNHFRPQ